MHIYVCMSKGRQLLDKTEILHTFEPLHWDTKIQGKKLVPENFSHNLCLCYLYLKDPSIQNYSGDT